MNIARLLALFGLFLFPSTGLANSPLVLGGSTEARHVVIGTDGETHVGVWVEAPVIEEIVVRAPISLSLVIDVSGSMSGSKIQYARMAASSLIESLADGDRVSLVTFNDQVQVLRPAVELSPRSRIELHQLIQSIYAMGGTNLYGGLATGIQYAAAAPGSHPVRRVVLVSDGQGNVGPSDPYSLGNLSSQGSEQRVQVSAIGVGMDYDEHALSAIAVRSAGRFYHLGNPGMLPTILENEIGLLAHTVATDVILEIVPAPGVIIIEGLTPGARLEGGKILMPMGSLHSGQRREVLFRARVQDGTPGEKKLASARLRYGKPGGGSANVNREIAAEVTRDRQVAASSRKDARVAALVAEHRASEAELRAAEALAAGNQAAAVAALAQAEQDVARAAAAAPASSATRKRLESKATKLRGTTQSAQGASTPAARRAVSLEARDSAMDGYGY
jgi:Ca-activated chloride channel homolog